MMRVVFTHLVPAIYLALPVVMAWIWVRRSRRQARVGPIVGLAGTVVAGSVLGSLAIVGNAAVFGGRADMLEYVRMAYLGTAAMYVVRLIDRLLMRGVATVARVRIDSVGHIGARSAWRTVLALLVQRALLLAVALPYLLTMFVIFRPRLQHRDGALLSLTATERQAVWMRSADGLKLCAWWVPASPAAGANGAQADDWGRRTAVLMPGFGAGKAQLLGPDRGRGLIAALVEGGFNVLALDPRASGRSDGHFSTLGYRERLDVLAAVQWLTENRSEGSRRIVAVGINTGAAAVVLAAADARVGQAIQALALIEPYASTSQLIDDAAGRVLPRPVAWWAGFVGRPIMWLHTGTSPSPTEPGAALAEVWPRPILVVHGQDRSFVPISRQVELYAQAPQPKARYFPVADYEQRRSRTVRSMRGEAMSILRDLAGVSDDSIHNDAGAQDRIVRFLGEARPVPVL